jgi:hypothetical protein
MLVCNVIDLCFDHHEQLESQWGGCKARLRFAGGAWIWYRKPTNLDRDEERIWWADKLGNAWILVGFVKADSGRTDAVR